MSMSEHFVEGACQKCADKCLAMCVCDALAAIDEPMINGSLSEQDLRDIEQTRKAGVPDVPHSVIPVRQAPVAPPRPTAVE